MGYWHECLNLYKMETIRSERIHCDVSEDADKKKNTVIQDIKVLETSRTGSFKLLLSIFLSCFDCILCHLFSDLNFKAVL